MVKLLITRPEIEAKQTAKTLHDMGFETIISPLLTIQSHPEKLPKLTPETPLIITSKQALQILAETDKERNYTLYLVGEQTAALARKLGYQDISFVAQDNTSLLHHLCTTNKNQTFCYLRGTHITHKLDTNRIAVEEHIIYTAHQVPCLNIPAATLQDIDGAIFYSRRTLEAFYNVMPEHLEKLLPKWFCFCLSPAIYQSDKHPWKRFLAPDKPDSQSLLKLIKDFNFTNA
jgi:uroporphyrinogen-III synthase